MPDAHMSGMRVMLALFLLLTIVCAPPFNPITVNVNPDSTQFPEGLKNLLNCSICEDLTGYLESGIFISTNEETQTMEAMLFTSQIVNNQEVRMPIKHAPIVIHIVGEGIPDVNVVMFTDDDGVATFDFSDYSKTCRDYVFVYPHSKVGCGFQKCLAQIGIDTVLLGYGTVGDLPLVPGHSIPPQAQDPPLVKPVGAIASYCPPPKPLTPQLPVFCLPLAVIFALLGGAMYVSGRNPFSMFDLSTPRMSKTIKYSARGRGISFDVMAIANAISKAKSEKKAKAQDKKDMADYKQAKADKAAGKKVDAASLKKPESPFSFKSGFAAAGGGVFATGFGAIGKVAKGKVVPAELKDAKGNVKKGSAIEGAWGVLSNKNTGLGAIFALSEGVKKGIKTGKAASTKAGGITLGILKGLGVFTMHMLTRSSLAPAFETVGVVIGNEKWMEKLVGLIHPSAERAERSVREGASVEDKHGKWTTFIDANGELKTTLTLTDKGLDTLVEKQGGRVALKDADGNNWVGLKTKDGVVWQKSDKDFNLIGDKMSSSQFLDKAPPEVLKGAATQTLIGLMVPAAMANAAAQQPDGKLVLKDADGNSWTVKTTTDEKTKEQKTTYAMPVEGKDGKVTEKKVSADKFLDNMPDEMKAKLMDMVGGSLLAEEAGKRVAYKEGVTADMLDGVAKKGIEIKDAEGNTWVGRELPSKDSPTQKEVVWVQKDKDFTVVDHMDTAGFLEKAPEEVKKEAGATALVAAAEAAGKKLDMGEARARVGFEPGKHVEIALGGKELEMFAPRETREELATKILYKLEKAADTMRELGAPNVDERKSTTLDQFATKDNLDKLSAAASELEKQGKTAEARYLRELVAEAKSGNEFVFHNLATDSGNMYLACNALKDSSPELAGALFSTHKDAASTRIAEINLQTVGSLSNKLEGLANKGAPADANLLAVYGGFAKNMTDYTANDVLSKALGDKDVGPKANEMVMDSILRSMHREEVEREKLSAMIDMTMSDKVKDVTVFEMPPPTNMQEADTQKSIYFSLSNIAQTGNDGAISIAEECARNGVIVNDPATFNGMLRNVVESSGNAEAGSRALANFEHYSGAAKAHVDAQAVLYETAGIGTPEILRDRETADQRKEALERSAQFDGTTYLAIASAQSETAHVKDEVQAQRLSEQGWKKLEDYVEHMLPKQGYDSLRDMAADKPDAKETLAARPTSELAQVVADNRIEIPSSLEKDMQKLKELETRGPQTANEVEKMHGLQEDVHEGLAKAIVDAAEDNKKVGAYVEQKVCEPLARAIAERVPDDFTKDPRDALQGKSLNELTIFVEGNNLLVLPNVTADMKRLQALEEMQRDAARRSPGGDAGLNDEVAAQREKVRDGLIGAVILGKEMGNTQAAKYVDEHVKDASMPGTGVDIFLMEQTDQKPEGQRYLDDLMKLQGFTGTNIKMAGEYKAYQRNVAEAVQNPADFAAGAPETHGFGLLEKFGLEKYKAGYKSDVIIPYSEQKYKAAHGIDSFGGSGPRMRWDAAQNRWVQD